jgi:hemerythrin-like domain-containing protein
MTPKFPPARALCDKICVVIEVFMRDVIKEGSRYFVFERDYNKEIRTMKPRGPLMKEHRVIECMIDLMRDEVQRIKKKKTVDPRFIDTAVDFIRTYADRTHHGKEEYIMFRDLAEVTMSDEHHSMMEDLIKEHVFARNLVKRLVDANIRYVEGQKDAVDEIIQHVDTLVDFYPEHIRKEDEEFFPAAEEYMSEEIQRGMLEEFDEFDKTMIHEKYENVVNNLKEAR